jgi:7,8-dihydropterin-6-yl-methyl-4-(beta-D-ribofuranosyl)aminobenzene 5'-phosphate synthase
MTHHASGFTFQVKIMIQLTVLYDNYAFQPEPETYAFKSGLETAWGFASLIEGFEKTILFDTGGDAAIFRRNMEKLQIDFQSIDALVLSHAHWDHQNGIPALLEQHTELTVYLLKAFPAKLSAQATGYGADVVDVEESLKLCENVYSTGKLGSQIPEQSLVLLTERGLILVTGCAHPGVIDIVKKAKDMFDDEVLLVMGGFHLLKEEQATLKRIVEKLRALGVQYVAPTHCSGDLTRQVFKDVYGANYLEIGVGKVLMLEDL